MLPVSGYHNFVALSEQTYNFVSRQKLPGRTEKKECGGRTGRPGAASLPCVPLLFKLRLRLPARPRSGIITAAPVKVSKSAAITGPGEGCRDDNRLPGAAHWICQDGREAIFSGPAVTARLVFRAVILTIITLFPQFHFILTTSYVRKSDSQLGAALSRPRY